MTLEAPPADTGPTPARSRSPHHPRQVAQGLLVTAWSHPWWGASLTGVAGWAVWALASVGGPRDGTAFAFAGEQILDGHFDQALSEPSIQSGPLTLTVLGLLERLADRFDSPLSWSMLVLSLITAFCLTAAIRACARPVDLRWAGGGLVAAWTLSVGWDVVDGSWGHPSHAVVPLLWLLAVRAGQTGRAVLAGVVLGVALGVDSWAVLGSSALLVLWPDRRAILRAGLAAALVGAVIWAPLLVSGGVRSGDMRWPVTPGSLASLIGQSDYGSGYRLGQLVLVLIVGALLTLRLRTDPDLAWLLPAVVVTARIVSDGQYIGYYAIPVIGALLTGVAVMCARRDHRLAILVPATILSALHIEALGVVAGSLLPVAGVCLATYAVLRPSGQPSSADTALSASE
jgi:hypothetical protein